MRRTKIVATLGPATETPEQIAQLIEAGMDVARINLSHGTHSEHAARIAAVRQEAERAGRAVGLLMDLQGPKIRTGPLPDGKPVELNEGAEFTITTRQIPGSDREVRTDYAAFPRDVHPGDRILISDGLIELRVLHTTEEDVITEVVHGGELRPNQGINLPGVNISAPVLSDKDRKDLAFGLEQGVDYVGVSFVRRAMDVIAVRQTIRQHGKDTPIIVKLEKPEAVEALDDILRLTDGVMVARGDLGVELPPEQVPIVHKRIIEQANQRALPVITATQMLESMIHNARPTRAEVSDVANAVLDGSDAVMLSGETAIGQYPIEAVRMIARIAEEMDRERQRRLRHAAIPWLQMEGESVAEAIAAAVAAIVKSLPVRAVCVLTKTGSTARVVSHFHPNVPILGFTPFQDTYYQLSLLWGVTPIKTRFADTEEEYYRQVEHLLLARGDAAVGDTVVITGGHPIAQGGPTNFLKIMTISEPATGR
jgi:pyruvate kinase